MKTVLIVLLICCAMAYGQNQFTERSPEIICVFETLQNNYDLQECIVSLIQRSGMNVIGIPK